MEIGFDPGKDASNLTAHGVSLAFGEIVLRNAVGEVEDMRHDYGEKRIKAFGQVNGLWFTCVYTVRAHITHIITVHRISERVVRRWLRQN